MKTFEAALLAAGLIMFGLLLKNMDFAYVALSLSTVGVGFVLIIGQELVAHVFNALGWKYSLSPSLDKKIPFLSVLKMRIAGDGINYLTPSATLAGEWSRAVMMGNSHTLEERLSSVAIAKITQAIAMVAASITGLVWAFTSRINFGGMEGQMKSGGWLIAGMIIAIVLLEMRAAKTKKPDAAEDKKKEGIRSVWQQLKKVDREIMRFLRQYPSRFAMSVLCFLVAYAWGAFEAYWICRFLGAPVTVSTAVLIELLSIFMDGIFFAVPGKAGTQEATKTAIFTALGMKPSAGFAFAVVRHIREIFWALTGFALYYTHRRQQQA